MFMRVIEYRGLKSLLPQTYLKNSSKQGVFACFQREGGIAFRVPMPLQKAPLPLHANLFREAVKDCLSWPTRPGKSRNYMTMKFLVSTMRGKHCRNRLIKTQVYAEELFAFHLCAYPGSAYGCYAEGADEFLFRSGEILNCDRGFVSAAEGWDKYNTDCAIWEQVRHQLSADIRHCNLLEGI